MILRQITVALTMAMCLFLASSASAGVLMNPVEAPEWQVSEWINGEGGRVAKYRQQVLVIHFFQMWCPGSNEFSIPLMEKWSQQFSAYPDFKIVSIHTVFEAHAQQTPELLRKFVTEKGIGHPVGVDAQESGSLFPVTMNRFDTGGTPHVVIVDRRGEIRFSHFGTFDPEPVEHFLKRILDEEKANILALPQDEVRERLKEERTQRQSRRGGRNAAAEPPTRRAPERDRSTETPEERPEDVPEEIPEQAPAEEDADSGDGEDDAPGDPDAELSGSYKLRFEQLARSCGEIGPMVEVITQVTTFDNRIVAKFSRPFLGVRQLEATFDSGSNDFNVETTAKGTEQGGVQVDLQLQMSGRYVSIVDPPEVEFDFYIQQTSEDGRFDCVIEGRGGGARFRSR